MKDNLSIDTEYFRVERIGFGKRLFSSFLDLIISIIPGTILGIYAGAAMAAFLLDFFMMMLKFKLFNLDSLQILQHLLLDL